MILYYDKCCANDVIVVPPEIVDIYAIASNYIPPVTGMGGSVTSRKNGGQENSSLFNASANFIGRDANGVPYDASGMATTVNTTGLVLDSPNNATEKWYLDAYLTVPDGTEFGSNINTIKLRTKRTSVAKNGYYLGNLDRTEISKNSALTNDVEFDLDLDGGITRRYLRLYLVDKSKNGKVGLEWQDPTTLVWAVYPSIWYARTEAGSLESTMDLNYWVTYDDGSIVAVGAAPVMTEAQILAGNHRVVINQTEIDAVEAQL